MGNLKKINIANSFGVNILGVTIPKNSIYGYWLTKSGHKLTYYVSALEDFERPCPNITAMVCYEKSTFRLSSISKKSCFGKFLCNYALNNILYGTRVEYPQKLHSNRYLVTIHRDPKKHDDPFNTQGFSNLKKPKTSFLGKVHSQEQIDGRSYADKLVIRKNGNVSEMNFYDRSYNGWADYK